MVCIRHGESVWNRENKFTGWTDVDLSERGIEEAHEAGRLLKKEGYVFDCAYMSWLVRAKHTLDIILDELGQTDIPVQESWRLNERHYGALQGLNKKEMAEKFGEQQVLVWRRSFDVQPPALTEDDPRYSGNEPKYHGLNKADIPRTESMKDMIERCIPYWEETLKPAVASGKIVLVSAHGNTIRGLKMFLDNMKPEDVVDLNIPYAIPLVYEFDDTMNVMRSYYLGDQEKIAAVAKEVANQGKAP